VFYVNEGHMCKFQKFFRGLLCNCISRVLAEPLKNR
jgi:hypothetical protein